jgi:hypothetical protein
MNVHAHIEVTEAQAGLIAAVVTDAVAKKQIPHGLHNQAVQLYEKLRLAMVSADPELGRIFRPLAQGGFHKGRAVIRLAKQAFRTAGKKK